MTTIAKLTGILTYIKQKGMKSLAELLGFISLQFLQKKLNNRTFIIITYKYLYLGFDWRVPVHWRTG